MMFVRTAMERDLTAVRALLVETWHMTDDPIYGPDRVTASTNERYSVAALKAQLVRPNSEFIVADDGNRIGATAYAASTAEPEIVMLHRLNVAFAFQRRGLGSMLLREIENSFPDARLLRLEMKAANAPATAFFSVNGFVQTCVAADRGNLQLDVSSIVLQKALA